LVLHGRNEIFGSGEYITSKDISLKVRNKKSKETVGNKVIGNTTIV
jgi:hypothetical protein